MLDRSRLWVGLILCLISWAAGSNPFDLSVVLCGRNDGHATDLTGDFVSRLRRTLLSLLLGFCARRSTVSSEVVLVEWRPPNTTRPLQALVQDWIDREFVWRSGEFNCILEQLPLVRLISVTNEDADSALESIGQVARGSMLEWHCKNIGLRRAAGDMLLTINADDILSPALFDFLAQVPRLRRDSFYLAQTLGLYFTGRPGAPHHAIYEELFHHVANNAAEQELGELVGQERAEVVFSKEHKLCQRPEQLWAQDHTSFEELWRDYDMGSGLQVNRTSPGAPAGMPRNFYDLYVGDFMLASRVAWRRINGAPLLLQSMYIDWLVLCRFASTLRQVVLVAPCFNVHQNHPHSMTLKKKRIDATPEWGGVTGSWGRCRHPLRSFKSEHGVERRQWGFPRRSFSEVRFIVEAGQVVARSGRV